MKRRSFFAWVGAGWVVSTLSAVLASCSPTKSKSTQPPKPDADGFQAIGTLATLDKNGQIMEKNSAAGPVLVVRNPANPETLSAVNPTCTHRDCTVDWNGEQKVFSCPCHGSQFNLDGKVLEGPATEPLPTYMTKIEGDQVLVKGS